MEKNHKITENYQVSPLLIEIRVDIMVNLTFLRKNVCNYFSQLTFVGENDRDKNENGFNAQHNLFPFLSSIEKNVKVFHL